MRSSGRVCGLPRRSTGSSSYPRFGALGGVHRPGIVIGLRRRRRRLVCPCGATTRGLGRRDVYLLRTETGWQVLGRQGGADGQEVTHYFDREDEARRMLRRMLDTVPSELSEWVKMTASTRR
jgi:hypothetical protein